MRMHRGGACWQRREALLLGLISLAGLRALAAADAVARLVDDLQVARSFKVRLQAAAVLARMKDPRVMPALARAAGADASPLVRVFVVKLLATNPGGDPSADRARAALRRALADSNAEVRRRRPARWRSWRRPRPRAAAVAAGER